MELYLLGSLLGLGYYLNSNEETKKKQLNYPKKMYRGNIYDNEQYDRVENEIYDRAKIKFDKAQNIYENNVVGKYTPDVLYNNEAEHNFSKGIVGGKAGKEGFVSEMDVNEFGESVRKGFCYVDENGSKYPCTDNNIHVMPMKKRFEYENRTIKADNAFAKVSNNEIKSWNDDGGVETHTELEEQFDLLAQAGRQGVKQTYDEPWHNNMVPFFGGSIKQNVDPLANESKLSRYTGQWDYSKKQKQEIAPMFTPEKNIKNVYGDNQFLEKVNQNIDRFIPSLMRTNEAPTEKIYVAPGLNLGYNENPDFGFHDPVRVLPKTTNELRAKNKPKLTYDKPIVSGKSLTQEGTQRLNVNKNRPELVVYNEKGERTFGAKAVVLGEMERPTFLLGRALRSFSTFFFGNAKDNYTTAAQSRMAYKDNNKKNLFDLNNRQGPAVTSVKRNNIGFTDEAKATRKTCTEKNVHKGHFTSIYKALTSYLTDPAKKTLKETMLSESKPRNLKTTRKAGMNYNADKAKNTLRQTTEENFHNGNVKTDRKVGKVYDPNNKAKNTVRQTTEENKHQGVVANTEKKQRVYDPEDTARYTIKHDTLVRNHVAGRNANQNNGAYQVVEADAKYTSKQDALVENYVACLKSDIPAHPSYEATCNAETNALKELIAKGRAPTQNSVKLAAGADAQNVDIKRIDADSKNPRGMETDLPNVDKLYVVPPTANECSMTKNKLGVYQQQNVDRISPDILDAFRNNPYTQSLHSYVFP
jgi:hypothetical protein